MSDSRRARPSGGNLSRACHSACVAGAHVALLALDGIPSGQGLVSRTVTWRRVAFAVGKALDSDDNTVDVACCIVVGIALRRRVGRKAVLRTWGNDVMLAIIAVACCLVVPFVVVTIVGLVTLVKEASMSSGDVPFHKRVWHVLLRG